MHDNQEMSHIVNCAFFLGVVYKVKQEKKHVRDSYTDEDVASMEKQLDTLMSHLSPEAYEYINDKRKFYDMALITDIYGWAD